jgi:RNA 3'-phosphate cyclase
LEFIEVDGSKGEGGGQILRAAIAFSAILRKPVRVSKIRAGRSEPGLKIQHLSALQALAKVFEGELTGAKEGSTVISFIPSSPRMNSLSIDMGTAASITLVLQAVVPAVALNHISLSLDLVGGTDVPWSPTCDYYGRVVSEAFGSIGIGFDLDVRRRGYYPRGGGKVISTVRPSRGVSSVDLTEKQKVPGARVVSRCGSLPRHVANRQLAAATKALESAGFSVLGSEIAEEQTDSPGSSILVYYIGEGAYLGADALGARGRPAEEVGKEAASRFVAMANSGAALDSNLADMLLPLLSMASRPSQARIPEVTEHLRSGLDLAVQFTSCAWSADTSDGGALIRVEPRQASRDVNGHNV